MKIVHCKRESYTVYIGRPSIFGNPFKVIDFGRDNCISRFEEYARNTPTLLEAIKGLPEDAILGCWCAPKPCHGDVIIKLWKELRLP